MNRKKILFYFATLVLIIALCVSCSKEDKLMTEPEASLSSQKTQTFEISNYESWDVGESYVKGDTVSYEGKIYKCIQPHTVDAENWNPPNTPALWAFLGESGGSGLDKGYKVWDVNRIFETGDSVVYKGKKYRCRQGNTARSLEWAPPNKPTYFRETGDFEKGQVEIDGEKHTAQKWREGEKYTKGDIVYLSLRPRYRCTKTHISNASNKPRKVIPESPYWEWVDLTPNVWPHNDEPHSAKNLYLEKLYAQWKKLYVKQTKSGPKPEYKIRGDSTPENADRTSSEAMGYGMLITAMMAGANEYDDVAPTSEKKLFDGLLRRCLNNKAGNGSDLIDWTVGDKCPQDDNATDGDMDIAYALLIADIFKNASGWGDHMGPDETTYKTVKGPRGFVNWVKVEPGPRYRDIAEKMIEDIKRYCLYTDSKFSNDWRIRPGYAYDSPDEKAHSSRTSDWMPGHLYNFYCKTDDRDFVDAAYNSARMAKYMQNNFSPQHGFLPDFITNPEYNDNFDADEYKICPVYSVEGDIFNEDTTDDDYAYNACRFPLRFAVALKNPELNSETKEVIRDVLNNYLDGLNNTLKWGQIRFITGGYKLNGEPLYEWKGSRAFAAPAYAAAEAVDNSPIDPWQDGADFINPDPTYFGKDYYSVSLSLLSGLCVTDNWVYPYGYSK